MTTERNFEATAAAVPLARRFVLGEIGDTPKKFADSIAVMVSELASNAVLHAHSRFRISVERLPGSVRVDVTDYGGGFPEPQLAPPSDALHGRGLYIVKNLAEEWGITESRDGGEKSVWFKVDISEAALPHS